MSFLRNNFFTGSLRRSGNASNRNERLDPGAHVNSLKQADLDVACIETFKRSNQEILDVVAKQSVRMLFKGELSLFLDL